MIGLWRISLWGSILSRALYLWIADHGMHHHSIEHSKQISLKRDTHVLCLSNGVIWFSYDDLGSGYAAYELKH